MGATRPEANTKKTGKSWQAFLPGTTGIASYWQQQPLHKPAQYGQTNTSFTQPGNAYNNIVQACTIWRNGMFMQHNPL